MANPYDQEIIEIAGIIRGASESGDWGNFEIGIPISEIPETYGTDINSDKVLKESVLGLSLCDDELSAEDQKNLISCFIYCSKVISDVGINPNQAIWNKYCINLYTYAIPMSASMMEINRHSALGGEYKEGIFDEVSRYARKSRISLELRDRAYHGAETMVERAGFPYGIENVGVIQLVFKDWLMGTGKTFRLSEMRNLLLGEIDELSKSKKKIFGRRQERAYEACDVMIWIMHMFSIKGIKMGALLEE